VSPEDRQQSAIIADIGATNIRLALLDQERVAHVKVLPSADYSSIHDAFAKYFENLPAEERRYVNEGAIAVAAPVTSDWISLTNQAWSFSKEQLRESLGLERLLVVNDFTAVASAVPHLKPNERFQFGGGAPLMSAPIGVIGPGSGLGVGALIPVGNGWLPLPGEGGHVTLAAATTRESDMIERLRVSFGHVSAERILSGPGLVNLHQVLVEMAGLPAISYTAEQITDSAFCERDPHCRETVELFCSFLGTVAGNLALTIGAHGGIYIAGGIVPKLGSRITQSGFRKRFEEKGRLQPYVSQIPTFVIVHPFPAFVGLSKLLNANSPEAVF
jgi:glucokinase